MHDCFAAVKKGEGVLPLTDAHNSVIAILMQRLFNCTGSYSQCNMHALLFYKGQGISTITNWGLHSKNATCVKRRNCLVHNFRLPMLEVWAHSRSKYLLTFCLFLKMPWPNVVCSGRRLLSLQVVSLVSTIISYVRSLLLCSIQVSNVFIASLDI
jgi:hypothetical protein